MRSPLASHFGLTDDAPRLSLLRQNARIKGVVSSRGNRRPALIPLVQLAILCAEPASPGIPITRAQERAPKEHSNNKVDHRRRKDDTKIVPLSGIGNHGEGNV
jgi:hypothetical protein